MGKELIEYYPGVEHIGYPADPMDSFGRLNVAEPFTLIEAQFNYGLQPSLFQESVNNGSVTHLPLSSAIRLSTGGTASGNKATFQSRRYFRYQPGKAHQAMWTCVMGEQANNVRKIAGVIDDQDGLAFIQTGAGLGVLRRTSTSGSAVDNIIWQSAWNLDKLDGNGLSRQNLDMTKDNIFVIDYQWLGAGRVRWGFDFSGHVTYCHQLQWANTDPLPYMRTGNLPFRIEIGNTGIADDETELDFTCLVISSGGGSEPFSLVRSTSNDVASAGVTPLRTVTATPLPTLSIRPRTTFNGLTNRGQVRPVKCQIASKDAPVAYSVIRNGTLTGASFSDVDSADSNVEVDVSATAISGGTVIASGYLGAGAGMQAMGTMMVDLEGVCNTLSNNIPGDEAEILSVVISLINGAPSGCSGAFSWDELR